MRIKFVSIAAALALSAGVAIADRLEMKNGDVLTGKVIDSDGKTLKFKSDAAGEVKVNFKDIKTFSSDDPLEFRLVDGTVLKRKAVPATQGSVGVDSEIFGAKAFTLDKIKSINPAPATWNGSVVAGAVLARGNTYTDQYHAAFDLNRRSDDDRFTSNGAYNYGRDRDPDTGEMNTSANNWLVQGKYDHFLHGSKWYLFANTLIAADPIQDLKLRFIPGVGVGYQWIESPAMNFNTEAGLSYVYENYSSQETRNSLAARLAYHFDKTLGDHVKFINNFEYIPTLEDGSSYLINADAGVRTDLTKTPLDKAQS